MVMNPYPIFNMDEGHQQPHSPFEVYQGTTMTLSDGVSPTYGPTTLVPTSTTAASSSDPLLMEIGKGGKASSHESTLISSSVSTSRPIPTPGGAAPSMMAATIAGPRQELDAADIHPPQSEGEALPPPYKYRPRSDQAPDL